MTEKPALDPEIHEDDTVVSVWKRRAMLVLLILLVVAIAAPTFGGCSGFFETKTTAATFEVAGRTYDVSDADLIRFIGLYSSTMRLLGFGRGLPEGEDGVREALRKMVLDAAAKAEGVRVADDEITQVLSKCPQFQVGGRFDEARYRSELANFSRFGLTHEFLADTLRTEIRAEEYERLGAAAFQVVPGEEAYEAWKKRNQKLTVEYAAAPYDAQRARIAAMEPADEDLKVVAGMPAIRALLTVPPRKIVEVAYVRVADLAPEQLAAAKTFAAEAEIFTEERPLEAEAFVLFHAKRDSIFTRERWGVLKDPQFPKTRREYDAWRAEWERQPKETREPERPEPKDPAADYPEEMQAEFALWRDRTEKEVLAERIVRHLVLRAEREGKPLADVAAEYARFGVRVVRNAEPLSDDEIAEKFPDPVARDSEFNQVAVVIFKAPAEGAVFRPQYQTQPVPTTSQDDRIDDRGFMVMRLESCDVARQYPISERRDAVVEFWRKHQVAEAAKAAAEAVRKKAEAAGGDAAKLAEALRAAAAESGLVAGTLRRFNRTTEAPRPPVAASGETLAPEVAAAARRIAVRNRVQQEYQSLLALEPGKFRDGLVVDDGAEAAIVVLVTEKYEPKAIEMRDEDLRQERLILAYQAKAKADELFSYESLAKRFHLKRPDEKPKKPEPKPEDG